MIGLTHLPTKPISSKKLIAERRWRILGLVNIDNYRDITASKNKILVEVPVSVINPTPIHNLTVIVSASGSDLTSKDVSFFKYKEPVQRQILTIDLSFNEKVNSEPLEGTSSSLHGEIVGVSSPNPSVQPGSSAHYETTVRLEPGVNSINFTLSCSDDAIQPAFVLLDTERSSKIGYIPPLSTIVKTGPTEFNYGSVTNLGLEGADLPATVGVTMVATSSANSTTCTLDLGASTQNFTVIIDQTPASDTSAIHLESDISYQYYQVDGGQVAVNLHFTVPYDEPEQLVNISVFPEPLESLGVPHFLHMCNLEVTGPEVELRHLQVDGLQPTYSHSTNHSTQWMRDKGDIAVNTAHAIPNRKVHKQAHKFTARAIFENPPNQDYVHYLAGVPASAWLRKISSVLTFGNGTSVNKEVNFTVSRGNQTVLTDQNSWSSCLGGWISLPSGKMTCHVVTTKAHTDRRDYCARLGGYLMELHEQQDVQAYLYNTWHLAFKHAKSKTAMIATGATVILDANGTEALVWQYSRTPVDFSNIGLIRPGQNGYGNLVAGYHLYLLPHNLYDNNLLETTPYPYMEGMVFTDTEAEFTCMRDGDKNSPELGPVMEVVPLQQHETTWERSSVYSLKFNVKLRHMTQMSFALSIASPGNHFPMCGIRFSHIGSNYPCLKSPNFMAKDRTNSTQMTVNDQLDAATVFISQLSNWGSGPFNNEGPLDSDTVQITTYHYVNCCNPEDVLTDSLLNSSINYQFINTPLRSIPLIISNTSSKVAVPPDNLAIALSTPDGNMDLVKGTCKRIRFRFSMPDYPEPVRMKVINTDHLSGLHIHWCNFQLRTKGANFPCVNPRQVIWTPSDNETEYPGYVKYDTSGTKEFYREIVARDLYFLRTAASTDLNDDVIEMELSVRADKEMSALTRLSLQFQIEFTGPTPVTFEKMFLLTVKDMTPANDPTQIQSTAQRKFNGYMGAPLIYPVANNNTTGGVRDTLYPLFGVNFPVNTTLPVKMLIKAPVVDGRAVLHLKSVQFVTYKDSGRNMLGVNPYIDIERTYSLISDKTSNLYTHMQRDSIFVDFGLITNTDYSTGWESPFRREQDNAIFFVVETEISDHMLTEHGSQFPVEVAMTIGDFVVCNTTNLTVERTALELDRMTYFRPFMEFNLTQAASNQFAVRGNVVSFTSVVKHTNVSLGEGYPAIVRIRSQHITSFITAKNNITTNYTGLSPVFNIMNEENREGAYVDIVFPTGLMFPDVVEVNFSLTVDPFMRMQPKTAEFTAPVEMSAVGKISRFSNYPAMKPATNETMPTSLGSMQVININIRNQECETLVKWVNASRQIRASFRYSKGEEHAPANVISSNGSWTVPVRSGSEWVGRQWVDLDFLTIYKVTRMSVNSPLGARAPEMMRLDHSLNGKHFTKGEVVFVNRMDFSIKMSKPITTRFLRLVIDSASEAVENKYPIKMYSLQIYGCVQENVLSPKSSAEVLLMNEKPHRRKRSNFTLPDETVSGDDRANYRTFAVDDLKAILYYCDVNPYRGGTACYSTINLGRSWIGLPQYIHNIVGHSPLHGRTYFMDQTGKAFMSCFDGKRIDVIPEEKMNEVMAEPSFIQSQLVPGFTKTELDLSTFRFTESSSFTANYNGISLAGKSVLRFVSCCVKSEDMTTVGP